MRDVRFGKPDLLKLTRMKTALKFSFALILISLSLTACNSSNTPTVNDAANNQPNASRNMNQSNAQNVEVKTDLAELEKQINLPIRPSEVKWMAETFDNETGAVPGPNDYRLTALLKYDEKSAAELTRKIESETADKSFGRTDVKSWFPDEIKNQAKTVDGRQFLEGEKYPVDGFARGNYRNGVLIRIGTSNYFVLNLFSF